MLLLAGAGGPLRADPLYPLLRPATVDSIKQELSKELPDPQRLKLLLRLCQDLIEKHGYLGASLESADFYCRQALTLSRSLHDARGQIESSYVFGNLCLVRDQVPEGRKWISQGLASSIRQHEGHLEADGWYYLTNTYTFSDADITRRIACLRRAMALYQTVDDGAHAAYTLKTIADLHIQLGQDGIAREELRQVLVSYRAIGHRRLHYTYDLLGVVNSRLGNLKEALRDGLASIESAYTSQDTADLTLFYSRVGNLYYALKQYPDALTYFNLVARQAEQKRNKDDILYATSGITSTLIAQNRPQQALRLALDKLRQYPPSDYSTRGVFTLLSNCYLANRQFTKAEKICLERIHWLDSKKQQDFKTSLLDTYFIICQLYLTTQQYSKARLYARKAWALQPAASISRQVALRLLQFKLDSIQGNYLAAIAHQQRYQALQDSMFNEKKSQQIASLQIQYDTRKKEQDLALFAKQSLVQQANLRQRESQRNALLAGTVMLALLLGLGYNRYRLKQRSNQQLEARQAEIDRKNAALETLVLEKEWLLKEIHHRVKNNLQVIMSLLNSQASYLPTNTAALAAIQESQHRVQAMALIHQKLYQSEQVARIAMPDYLNELVTYLRDSYDLPQPVAVELDVAPIEMDVNMAVPLGLIINEAITNALKYAFPLGRPGRIRLSLQHLLAASYQLVIEDDGVGLGLNYAPKHSRSLGMTLIHGFSRQLGGELIFKNDHGLKIQLVFHEPQLASAPTSTEYAYQ